MRSSSATTESASFTRSSRSFFESFVSSSGSSTFWYAVSTGSRLNCWKTKPTCRERQEAPLLHVERNAGEDVDALRVALERLVDVADLDEGHGVPRGG